MMSIMEEQTTENEYKVESDKQLFHEDLSFNGPLSHPPLCPLLSQTRHFFPLTRSLSLCFVVTYFCSVFVCVVSKCLLMLS